MFAAQQLWRDYNAQKFEMQRLVAQLAEKTATMALELEPVELNKDGGIELKVIPVTLKIEGKLMSWPQIKAAFRTSRAEMQQAIQTINDNLEDIQRKANLEMTKLLPIVPADTDFDGPPTLGPIA